jgi:hypothetical protein
VSISGNEVRELQLSHALSKLVPLEVSSNGNDSKAKQLFHARKKFVTFPEFKRGNEVNEVHPSQL